MSLAPCPTCGKDLSYIEKYNRWYCYSCSEYKEPMPSEPPPPLDKPDKTTTRQSEDEHAAPHSAQPVLQSIPVPSTIKVSTAAPITPTQPADKTAVKPMAPAEPSLMIFGQMPQLPREEKKGKGLLFYIEILFIMAGVVLIIITSLHDPLKIGLFGYANFNSIGQFQMIMLIISLVILVIGIILMLMAARRVKKIKEEDEKKPIVLTPLPPGEYPFQPPQSGR